MNNSEIIEIARRTISKEATAIHDLSTFINEDFKQAIELIFSCKGRLVITGIGKSAIVAQKIVATLNSTGTPALFMHAADAIHGDIGMILQEDIVILISKSGDSPEIKVLVPIVKSFGNKIVALVGNTQSFLALQADAILNTTIKEEACPNNLAPTTSTTAQMVMGDVLAICLMEMKGFGSDEFAKYHPGGTLGKKLYLRVQNLSTQNQKPQVKNYSTLKEVIIEITNKRLGTAAVVTEENVLEGIITDGDLRRMLEKNIDLANVLAKDIMSIHPKTIEGSALAVEALDKMRKNNITQLLVVEEGKYAGVIHLHDLLREGII